MRIVACRMRALREARDVPLREAETTSGVNRGYLSRIERGQMLPLNEWEDALEAVYGPRGEWYGGTVTIVDSRGAVSVVAVERDEATEAA